MPFVGKDLKTLTFQKQRQLDELRQKSKNMSYYAKNKQYTKETGSSITAKTLQPTTLEQYLDLSNIDSNIENFLIKELGANRGQTKIFVQGLDEHLKKFLLDRLPAFKKIFNDNFTFPTAINLKSAFELFEKSQIEKMKDIDIPTRADLENYLEDFNRERLYSLGLTIYIESKKKTSKMNPTLSKREFNNDYEYLSFEDDPEQATRDLIRDIILDYIRTFENQIDGWMATYAEAKRLGLTDFPKPKIKETRQGELTSTIRAPISEFDRDESSRSDTSDLTPGSRYYNPGFINPIQPGTPSSESSDEVDRLLERARGYLDESRQLGRGLVKIYKLKK